MQLDLLILNAAQIVTCAGHGAPLRGMAMRDPGIITAGAIAIHEGKIVAVGKSDDLRTRYTANQVIDAEGKAVVPGFVDPHTHVVYAGDRIDEFELRIQGSTYQEIMARGGGINNSVRSVRAASLETILNQTRVRLDAMLKLGTTTAEVKSGYGLDTASELKLLAAIATLDQTHLMDLIPTFMGAHAIPPEYAGRSEAYIQMILDAMLPAVSDWYQLSHFAARNIPLFIDVFCEQNAFTLEQSQRVLAAGKAAGMQVKAHVDEFNPLGGVQMALELEAVSVDHLDVTPAEDFQRLAQSNTVAVVIPAVNFNLGSTHFANARGLIDAGALVALTTDINPGSAPCPSMPLVMAIACRYQKLLPAEALIASTINAAYAIGMGDRIGSLEAGKQADVLILSTPDYRHLAYQFGGNLVETVIKRGIVV